MFVLLWVGGGLGYFGLDGCSVALLAVGREAYLHYGLELHFTRETGLGSGMSE